MNGLETEISQLKDPVNNVARNVLVDGVGAVAAEYFGSTKAKVLGKKLTRALMDGQRNQNARVIATRYYQQYFTWFQETYNFISGISISAKHLISPGNSSPLLHKLSRAEGFQKLNTRIRHVITALEEIRAHELVLNSSLPTHLEYPEKRWVKVGTSPLLLPHAKGMNSIAQKPNTSSVVEGFEFDVAFSFAGTERALAENLAAATRNAGFKVFYDGFYPEQLWGKDLVEFFDYIYRKSSRFCVMLISREYRDRMWTTQERRSALARALEEKGNEYLLPIELEKVEIDGLRPTIGHIPLNEYGIDQISEILVKKLKLGR